ncbi:MAG TPA: HDOD domain-containing protein [Bryobacteraceae bacterium]|nr:HDOD domain-containing protein [Bryobacteraceae bacterium]
MSPDDTPTQVETLELGELAKLPPFRPVVIRLLRLFDGPDVDIGQVCSLVEADPSLASEMLAVVNSPLFSVWERVSHSSHAIVLLGAERTKSLAATLALRGLLAGGPHTPIQRRFWMHSLATAIVARHLALDFQIAPEQCHVAALLHDLGRNGLLAAYPERYASLACSAYASTAEILDAETAEFGMTHCHAGALLAHAWHLPPIFEEVAEDHHRPDSLNPLVSLVQLSCRLADDLLYQSIHRYDVGSPEETIAQMAPAIDSAIHQLDF